MIALRQEVYPKTFEIINILEENFSKIKEEFLSVVSEQLHTKWHETYLYTEGWNVFGLRFQGNDIQEAHQLCPFISSIILKNHELIDTAGFSILKPNTVIFPHEGYTDDVLRCHLGITVPKGDCCLRVGETIIKWQEGEAFIFDDMVEHEAWNKTDETRVVMLIDLKKDVLLQEEFEYDYIEGLS
jgi:ornithine lipid ester-linked acyl 2-hydroxylase